MNLNMIDTGKCGIIRSLVHTSPKFSVFLCNPPFKYKGESLKDKLLTEIVLMQNLLVIIFGFRELQKAMTGDREAMFLLKKMPPQELRELRFLWRSKLENKIGLY